MSDIGALLKQQRENKGLSLEDIEKELKIRTRVTKALEEGDFKQLPDPVTSVGLIRSYAGRLGLDAAETVAQFRQEIQGLNKTVDIEFPDMLPSNFKPAKWGVPVAFVLIAVFYYGNMSFTKDKPMSGYVSEEAAALIYEKTGQDVTPNEHYKKIKAAADKQRAEDNKKTAEKTRQETLELEEISDFLEEPEKKIAESESAAPKEAPGIKTGNITIIAARGDSWVEIQNKDKKTVYSELLRKGTEYTITDIEEGMTLKVGAGYALDVKIGDDLLETPFGKYAGVIRNLPLEADKIKNYQP